MKLMNLLQSQGYGSRRECEIMIKRAKVMVGEEVVKNPKLDINPQEERVLVDRQKVTYRERVVIALNKPAGYECTHNSQAHREVFDLLTDLLNNRKTEPAGRLDADTTGLLILSDDGKLLHQLTSPKKEVQKIYRVTAKHAISDEMLDQLKNGVVLRDDSTPVTASLVEKVEENVLDLGITSGRYHQVKRMIAAVGNRVEKLHRSHIGSLSLEELDVPEGQFTFLSEDQVEKLLK